MTRVTIPSGAFWMVPLCFGVLLVLAGVLVLLYPAILVAIVAAVIVSAGVGLIGMGWRMRKLERTGHGVTRVEPHQM